MKNRKKNHFKLWTIGILTILLLATPALYAYVVDGTEDIDEYIAGNLFINGTANLLTGASVGESIYVQNGGTLNMHSGNIGTTSEYSCFICVNPNAAGMTVYGTEFAVDNGTIDDDGNWTPDDEYGYGSGHLTVKYEDESEVRLWILSDNPIKLVNIENNNDENIEIDIKPGSDENVINLKSKGVVPVAVLTTDVFNAGNIDPDSVLFAGASPVHNTLCDVDEDGDTDMLFHFRTQELNLDETSTEAELTGTLKSAVTRSSSVADGDVIYGTDKVKIKSSKKN